MSNSGKILCALVALLIVGGIAGVYFSFFVTVMKKTSPDGRHVAKLVRTDGIDVNFRVYVDGRRVYWSPDFAPADADFREHIAWDETGGAVILEVAGERLFGYHAVERRALTNQELLNVQFTPFEELRYEGTVPSTDQPMEGVPANREGQAD